MAQKIDLEDYVEGPPLPKYDECTTDARIPTSLKYIIMLSVVNLAPILTMVVEPAKSPNPDNAHCAL